MNTQATVAASAIAAPVEATKEPKKTILPYLGEEYEGGSFTVNVPGDILSSRDGTGWNGRGFSIAQ